MSTILFDQTEPDDERSPQSEPDSPEYRADLAVGNAVRQAELLAAATFAVEARRWRLLLNTDSARCARLDRRCQQANQSQRHYIRELAHAIRIAQPFLAPERFGLLHVTTKSLVDAAYNRARTPWRIAAASN